MTSDNRDEYTGKSSSLITRLLFYIQKNIGCQGVVVMGVQVPPALGYIAVVWQT